MDQIIGRAAFQAMGERFDQSARGQFRFDQETRHHGKTCPGLGGLCEHHELIESRSAKGRGVCDPLAFQPFVPRARAQGLEQEGRADHVLRANDPVGLCPTGGGDGGLLFLEQEQMVRVGPVGGAEMDRGIEPLARQIERIDPHGQVDDHVGMSRAQLRQARSEPTHAEPRQGCDRQFAVARAHGPHRPGNLVQCRQQRGVDLSSCGIEHDPASAPFEQCGSGHGLDHGDLTADGALA
jgi:hypothetical protein